MSVRLPLLLTAALVLLAVLPVASASAEVRYGAVQDPLDTQTTGTLDPAPTAVEITGAAAAYDRAAGTVTVTVTFNAAADRVALVSFYGRRACTDQRATDGPDPVLTVEINAGSEESGLDDNVAEASLSSLLGTAKGPEITSPDGNTVSATITHPQFANRDYRCVKGGGYASNGRLDEFAFTFAGFGPKELTSATARSGLAAELTRRYGAGWNGPGSWTACPPEEYFEEGVTEDAAGPQQLCEFRIRAGSRWRHGSALMVENEGDIEPVQFSSSTFSKPLRTCRKLRTLRGEGVYARRLRAGGWVGCQDNSASLIRDLHRLRPGIVRVSFHGTNRAGFQDAVRFRCRLRARSGGRRTATCANALDDRFIYSFRLRRR